jgi:hypothetical protein
MKHYGVLQEDRAKYAMPNFPGLAPHSPKRGKIRPKSAPSKAKVKKPDPVPYDDKYDERPKFSKVELDRIVKTNIKNNQTKKSGNKTLKDTADFATKMKTWGKGALPGEKNAKQGTKFRQEADRKAALEADMEHMLARQGADVTKSLKRIRSFRSKEERARDEMDLAVYDETMNNLLQYVQL